MKLIGEIFQGLKDARVAFLEDRDAWVDPLEYCVDDAILLNRLYEADSIVAVADGTWRMHLEGTREPWMRFRLQHPVVAKAFHCEAQMDFRSLRSGVARTGSLEAWFLDNDYVNDCDTKFVSSMLVDVSGAVFDPDKAPREDIAEIIVKLGEQEHGVNYLGPYINTLTNDPVFTEVRDKSNANFVWFIKFEQSYKKAHEETAVEVNNVTQLAPLAHSSDPNPKGEVVNFSSGWRKY